MEKSIIAFLSLLMGKKYIGGRHVSEKRVFKLISFSIEDKAIFKKEYRNVLNQGMIMRMMKRTGKGSDWHVSINPRKLKMVYKIIRGEPDARD